MPHPKPNKFASIQDYLDAVGFITSADFFVCGEIRFPLTAVCGHTVTTFVEKMRVHEWMPPDVVSPILWPLI
jgi:hypothetical protein